MSRRFDVVTLFPEMFQALTGSGITRRAHENRLFSLTCWNPRDYAEDAYRRVDDRPYGGGPGMVMQPAPLAAAIRDAQAAQQQSSGASGKVIYLSPQGQRLDHQRVMTLSAEPTLTLLCGRYEGVDQRVIDGLVDMEVSLGDFVLSGGELPAMVLLDSIIRQLPGALNDGDSAIEDSFVGGLLDCPHYTRPEAFEGREIPEVLRSGDHRRIRQWRLKQSLKATLERRPDLLQGRAFSREELRLLDEIRREQDGRKQ